MLPVVVQQIVHRSEEHTSELQSQSNLVCRLLLEKKKSIPAANKAWPSRSFRPATSVDMQCRQKCPSETQRQRRRSAVRWQKVSIFVSKRVEASKRRPLQSPPE